MMPFWQRHSSSACMRYIPAEIKLDLGAYIWKVPGKFYQVDPQYQHLILTANLAYWNDGTLPSKHLLPLHPKGLKAGQMSNNPAPILNAKDIYLDDYFGFSTDLKETFKETGAAAWERRSLNSDAFAGVESLLTERDLEDEANNLEMTVHNMINRDTATRPKFYPGMRDKLAKEGIEEFYLSNGAYQHEALVHIQRNVRQPPITDPKIQFSVKKILDCVRGIQPRGGLSPSIVLTVPLFTAGREALGDDREEVRRAVSRIGDELKLRNIRKTLEYLERHWAMGSIADEANYGLELDFIPY